MAVSPAQESAPSMSETQHRFSHRNAQNCRLDQKRFAQRDSTTIFVSLCLCGEDSFWKPLQNSRSTLQPAYSAA
jgi:hypothetical protein